MIKVTVESMSSTSSCSMNCPHFVHTNSSIIPLMQQEFIITAITNMNRLRYYQLRNEEESVALNTGLTIEQSLLSARELNHMLIAVLEPLYDHILTEDRKACSQRFVFSHMKQRVHEESVEVPGTRSVSPLIAGLFGS